MLCQTSDMIDDSLTFSDTCGNHLCEMRECKCMPEKNNILKSLSERNWLGCLEKGAEYGCLV